MVPFGTDADRWAAVLVDEMKRLPLEYLYGLGGDADMVVAMYHLAPFRGHMKSGATMDFTLDNNFNGTNNRSYTVYAGDYDGAKFLDLGTYRMVDDKLSVSGMPEFSTIVVTEEP